MINQYCERSKEALSGGLCIFCGDIGLPDGLSTVVLGRTFYKIEFK